MKLIYPKEIKFKDADSLWIPKQVWFNDDFKHHVPVLNVSYGSKGTSGGIVMTAKLMAMMKDHLSEETISEMMPKSKVIQQAPYECVIASIAMITNEGYEDLKKFFEKYLDNKNKGLGYSEKALVLNKMGYSIMQHDRYPEDECLITLKSLNVSGKYHCVYWNGKEILDPQFNNPQMKWYPSNWGPQESGGLRYSTIKKKTSLKSSRIQLNNSL